MKICVGLSGGVDSSVAALLLKRQGYDVFAMFMQNWHETEGTLHGDCEWEEDRFVAEMVARKLEIPFYFVDLSKEYRKRVVDYMFDEYSKGRTPNPDVLCNREIKFDAFLEAARKLGADAVATGHYCRKAFGDESNTYDCTPGREYRLLEGVDPGKDQSYFLCQLSQEQLSRAIFPIGGMLKSEVRTLAAEAELPSADKKDSQGICFVGKVDLPVFLQQKLKSVEGDIVEVYPSFYGPEKPVGTTEAELMDLSEPEDYSTIVFETETYRSGKRHIKKTRYKSNPYGKIVGRHIGAQFYTLGQRKGLGVGGHESPLFVIATDMESNCVYVGEGENHPGLYRRCARLDAEEIHWMLPQYSLKPGESRKVRVRIRYREPLCAATLYMFEKAMYILFDAPERSITPGQFAAFYALQDPADPYDAPELLGSAVLQ